MRRSILGLVTGFVVHQFGRDHHPRGTEHDGPSDPCLSVIAGDDLSGVVSSAEVALDGLAHTCPDDIDAVPVAPDVTQVLLISDVCGSGNLTDSHFTFSDSAAPTLPDSGRCPDGAYRPTDLETGDTLRWSSEAL